MAKQPIQHWLTATSALDQLMHQISYRQQLTQQLRQQLPANLAQQCHVTDYQNNILTIAVVNSLAASQLRFNLPALQTKLARATAFQHLKNIQYKVTPWYNAPEQQALPTPVLSAQSADLIRRTANTITDRALQRALLKLAQNAQDSL